MLESIKPILLINLYWFSLPLLGYGLLCLLRKFALRRPRWNELLRFVLGQNLVLTFFLSFAFAVFLLGLFSIICYVFHLSVAAIAVFYLVLLIIGGGYVVVLIIKNLFNKKSIDIFDLKNQTLLIKLIFLLMLVVLVGDFAFSLYVGADMVLGSDTYFHLARIMSILGQGFNIQNSFYKGLPETSYNYNIVYALYALPTYLFHIFPGEVWRNSLAFFRLLEWTAIFTLAWYAASYWLKSKNKATFLASACTIFAVLTLSSQFFVADYPHFVALLWLVLLIIGFSMYEAKRTVAFGTLAFVAAFLVTFTHPTVSLMAALFVLLVFVIKALTEKGMWRSRSVLLFYGGIFIILMISPVITELFSAHLTNYQFSLPGGFSTIDIFGWPIKKPYFALSAKYFVAELLGLIGLLYLFYKSWHFKRQAALIAALIIFYPLIVYEPVGLYVLHTKLPYWVLSAFSAMNVLCFISIPIGVYAVVKFAHHYLFKKSSGWGSKLSLANATSLAAVLIIVVLAGLYASFMDLFQLKNRKQNVTDYSLMNQAYNELSGRAKAGDTVVADRVFSYFVPSVAPVKVIAIKEGHSSTLADYVDRVNCQQHLLQYFNYQDLLAVHASYVVLGIYDDGYAQQSRVINSKPYFKEIGQTDATVMYEFEANTKWNTLYNQPSFSACINYQKMEERQTYFL